LFYFSLLSGAEASSQPQFVPNPNVGPGDDIVRGKDDGLIFGFEIDPKSTEGLLCGAVSSSTAPSRSRLRPLVSQPGKLSGF